MELPLSTLCVRERIGRPCMYLPHKGVHVVCHVKIIIFANLRNAVVRETRASALTIKGKG